MKVQYNVKGADRKALVAEIENFTGEKKEYLGAPSFAFQVGVYHIDHEGTVSRTDSMDVPVPFISWMEDAGFQGEQVFEGTAAEAQEVETESALAEVQEAEASIPDDVYCVNLPTEGFTEQAQANLKAILASKAELIKKALGVNTIEFMVDEWIRFAWFHEPVEKAYLEFLTAVVNLAKSSKRCNAKEREVTNEKYAFRCFLLRLGFIGAEYKETRKVLLQNLSGDAAWKAKPAV